MWKCRDGRKIRVKDMDDAHLANTIRMLQRQTTAMKMNAPFPVMQGDMAQHYAESEFYSLMRANPGDIWPIYDDLVEEAYKRKMMT
jgi:hypothetical protein